MDHGIPQNSVVAKVKILLKNLNDKSPVFPTNPKELQFKVIEMASKDSFVGNLKVQDPDGDEVCFYFGKYSSKHLFNIYYVKFCQFKVNRKSEGPAYTSKNTWILS